MFVCVFPLHECFIYTHFYLWACIRNIIIVFFFIAGKFNGVFVLVSNNDVFFCLSEFNETLKTHKGNTGQEMFASVFIIHFKDDAVERLLNINKRYEKCHRLLVFTKREEQTFMDKQTLRKRKFK